MKKMLSFFALASIITGPSGLLVSCHNPQPLSKITNEIVAINDGFRELRYDPANQIFVSLNFSEIIPLHDNDKMLDFITGRLGINVQEDKIDDIIPFPTQKDLYVTTNPQELFFPEHPLIQDVFKGLKKQITVKNIAFNVSHFTIKTIDNNQITFFWNYLYLNATR
ncbi:hypothetical protein [Spiroplasma eriocheiris]|uniref:Lipoprotein n=1 Tax=Spiroplasma eriocheiris TaxID=315358 RepID=A0A0H3XM03_9MOLU|nr:hypothetical protein [Spiroplasma eriocheiris]AHF58177.1 hypothetical protein SPE_1062 [Spiroplasma eriocheiris CCTCC M 207170]AKM54614.1 hypothetical protein SERIO_v1c10580 [Spiroplasma eriocheiris]